MRLTGFTLLLLLGTASSGHADPEREFHCLCWVEVRSNVPGADVYVDGKERGSVARTPAVLSLSPGKHTVTVAKEGYADASVTFDHVAGAPPKLELHLEPLPVGYVHLPGDSIAGARVRLDGYEVCAAAPCRFQSPIGVHDLRVSRAGVKDLRVRLTIERTTEILLDVELRRSVPAATLAKGVGGVALIGGGAALGVMAFAKESTPTAVGAVAAGVAGVTLVTWALVELAQHRAPSTATERRTPLALAF